MKVLRFAFFVFLLLATALSVSAQGGPNPPHDGELDVPGLNDTVEILRDEWGVPHIYASNVYDLFFAQGYTQAMDRWWQMEFFRATGTGTIQELVGFNESVLGTDVYLRTLGFRQIAEQEIAGHYDEDSLAIMQAFADGVNAYILNTPQNDLALEYRVLGLSGVEITIEPWTPVDTLVWGKVMALQLSGNQSIERRLSTLSANLDPELYEDYILEYPFGIKPTIVLPEDLPVTEESLGETARTTAPDAGILGLDTDLIGDFELAGNPFLPFGYGAGIGSNNWVAHGDITDTGLPLMANDMHLSIEMPSIWYEIGLHCQPVTDECPYDVAGFTFSATPMIVAGHNARISWALTNVGPDTQDLYQIRVNPDNPLQYEWNGEWRDMTTHEEVINFGDGTEPITFTVRLTHHGPIINDSLEGFNNENPLAMRWVAFEPNAIFTAFRLLNQADNWTEFREAASFWDVPAQNLIYADVDGNIGYQTPGKMPVRAPGHTGQLPVPGWTDEYEWLGYVPYDLLPRI
ncbi:MAG: penicillin acylase family protein, partial [Chloroflexota bacterium]